MTTWQAQNTTTVNLTRRKLNFLLNRAKQMTHCEECVIFAFIHQPLNNSHNQLQNMSHSINYYTQLPEDNDKISTAIDNMSRDELIALATECLQGFKYNNSTYFPLRIGHFLPFMINTDKLPELAHGLLAKAI